LSLRKFFVENTLADAIAENPPLSAAEAIRNSEQKLSALAGECGRHVANLIAEIGAIWVRQELTESDRVAQIASVSARLVGAGALSGSPAIDDAAINLCAVADVMGETNLYDREAIDVHVWTMRQFASGGLSAAERATLLDALFRLRERLELRRLPSPVGASN
jgi:hypothetical protein